MRPVTQVDRRNGALLAVAAAAMFATMGAAIKLASAEMPQEMLVFLRSLFGLLVVLPWVLRAPRGTLVTHRFGAHLGRSVAGVAAMYCFFYALTHLPLAEAVLLNFSAPLFVPFLALAWLHEGVPRGLWVAIFAGFVGIALILKPGLALFSPAALVGLASGILAAVAVANIRHMAETEPTLRIVFYFCVISTLLSAVPAALHWVTPPPALWAAMALVGAIATAGQVLLTHSYSLAPAAFVGPFTYSAVIFAGLIGWGLWDETPDRLSALGTVLVCIAGAVAMRYAGGGPSLPGQAPTTTRSTPPQS